METFLQICDWIERVPALSTTLVMHIGMWEWEVLIAACMVDESMLVALKCVQNRNIAGLLSSANLGWDDPPSPQETGSSEKAHRKFENTSAGKMCENKKSGSYIYTNHITKTKKLWKAKICVPLRQDLDIFILKWSSHDIICVRKWQTRPLRSMKNTTAS